VITSAVYKISIFSELTLAHFL